LKKVLISGFEPFGSHAENSSQVIAEIFKEVDLLGFEIRIIILPVTFKSAFELLKTEIEKFGPDYVLCLGLAGERTSITVERVAINLIHSKIPDNDGIIYLDQVILQNGPAAYFSTLPHEKIRELKTAFPVEESYTAGTYVCNYLMYNVLNFFKDSDVKAGFIHLPHLKENRGPIHQAIVDILKYSL
jgi:pyroglutamyl-peptidase